MLKIAVAGANGRVGSLLVKLIDDADDLTLAAALTREDRELPGCDVLVDFSSPDGFRHWLGVCRSSGTAFVSGTTGLADTDLALLDDAAAEIAVLHATNTSLGVALLNRLAAQAAVALGPEFDIEIVEAHHRHKRDAPSGTAATLADAVLAARGQSRDALDFGRVGMTPREPGRVGVHSLRMGDVVGEHTAHFAAEGERLEITHKATSRATFARGALRCARWIAGRAPGRHMIEDVLGLA